MTSQNQIAKFTENDAMMELQSKFMDRFNKGNIKMELSARKYGDGSVEKSIKLTPMTIGDYIGIWAIALLKSFLLVSFFVIACELYKDVQAQIEVTRTETLIEMKICRAEFEQNQCSENYLIESMAQRCQELEICINQDIEMKIRTQQVWLQVLGNSIEKMFKALSIKTCIILFFLSAATSIIFIKN